MEFIQWNDGFRRADDGIHSSMVIDQTKVLELISE